MNFPIDDLKFAVKPTLYLVENVYLRYQQQPPIDLPGTQHLADIQADTLRAAQLAAQDPRLAKLLHDLFANGSLFGSIDLDSANSTGFVCFRGTEKGTEWLDDFEFAPEDFAVGGKLVSVHSGFLKVYRLARESMMAGLSHLPPVKRLIVTGHSLGSAVATLAALELKLSAQAPRLCCWTYASPRVFFLSTETFDTSMDQSLRVQNPVDVVTHVPMILQGYLHVAGGLSIQPKFDQFHSLMATYLPGLQQILDQGGTVQTNPPEDKAIAQFNSHPETV